MTSPSHSQPEGEYPHVRAAFINAIAEEGTKAEAVAWLQKQWNETCALRAELKALRGSGVQSRDDDWQQIETAPKDGTDILVWPYWSDRQPAQVHWRDLQRKPGRWEITPSFYCAGATPTHWQPLPAAPSLSSAHSRSET